MKTLCLFLISFSLIAADAPLKELTYQARKNSSENISIKVLNKLRVNDNCFARKNECLTFINKKIEKTKKEGPFKGNPASSYCISADGDSIILKDKKNNEYDYCRFDGNFLIDSWDLYESSKK
ncbi:MAG: DUF333 domain-containing protein [Rhizobacter sp.]|nr:DUF333 domain-containing protein [Bacteriovorax sp.]